MKRSLLWLAVVAALMTGWAQNSEEGSIDADNFVFEQRAGVLHYWDNVVLKYPGVLDLTCTDLEVRLTGEGGKLDRIIATTNVVIHIVQGAGPDKPGVTNIAYAHQAIFDGVSNVVRLGMSPTGVQPRVEGPEGTSIADQIVYDRTNDRFNFSGHVKMRFKPGKLPQGGLFSPRTNAPVTK